jgi:ubiquinone biosynthesis protein
MAQSGGLRLDQTTLEELAKAQARHSAAGRIVPWIVALALIVMALALIR